MRLGLIAEGLRDWLAIRLNRVPAPLADSFVAMMAARALMAGVRLGVFAVLAGGPASIDDLATRLQIDRTALAALVDALAAAGYLQSADGQIALAPGARPWLDPASPRSIAHLIEFNYDHWTWWSELETVITTGQAIAIHQTLADPAAWRRYVLAMYDLARLIADDVAAAVPLPAGVRRLIDVGGSHGEYAIALCRRHPTLRATVIDLPPAVAIGQEVAAAAGMADRVQYRPADVMRDDLGIAYDGALVFQVLHHFEPAAAVQLLARVAAALRPGGTLAVLEPVRAGRADQLGALLHLHYQLTSRGGVPTPAEIQAWLDQVGCQHIATHRLPTVPGLLLLTGIKPR